MSQSKLELPGAHGEVALIPCRRNGGCPGLSIRFLFAEEPKRGLGEMPRHGADGLRMALAPGDALVEATDVAVRVAAAHQTDRVRGFDECCAWAPVGGRRARPTSENGRLCRGDGYQGAGRPRPQGRS